MRTLVVAAALLAASDAFGQGEQPQPYYPPPPPQQQPQQPQQPQAQPPPPPQATPSAPSGPPSAAGSQGTSSTAQPGSPGASSQQVVVNPPSTQQPSTQPAAPPSSTTVINPPGGMPAYRDEIYVEQRAEPPSPFATVATDAAWGGLTGLLVGFGVTLVNSFDNWGRDLMVGAGSGVIIGAIVGTVHAAYNAREADRRRRVTYGDGMNRTDRDPVIASRPVVGFAFRF